MHPGPDPDELLSLTQGLWDSDVLPTLESYVRIPNLSQHFSPGWEKDGHMDKAVDLIADWCRSRPIDGIEVEVVRPPGLSPTIVIEVPASDPSARDGARDGGRDGASDPKARDGEGPEVLFYGHLDKQPEFTGWSEGLGPWEPVRRGDRLYGRGVADDGYSVFAALTSLEAVRRAGGNYSKCLVLIEGSEESGSPDLPAALEAIGSRIGDPQLVLALDSGCPTYDRLWCTTSLRGGVNGTLTVEVLEQGVHSGSAGGVVPSSFRIARMLLSRVEDEQTGEILLDELNVPVPASAIEAAKAVAEVAGEKAVGEFPILKGMELPGGDVVQRLINRTWRPSLSVIGAAGLPSLESAGNVLRPYTSLQLGFRLPPGCDSANAARALERVLTSDPPYGAKVTFEVQSVSDGWAAVPFEPWLTEALDEASRKCFGQPSANVSEGGSIPFMAMLAKRFPTTQILATGVLGPGSNAHGPNEFLDIPTAVKLTASIGLVLDAQSR
jgi:acetylornithine deacetylase/succinyl-diaminopimelate desuccinylase-like protein